MRLAAKVEFDVAAEFSIGEAHFDGVFDRQVVPGVASLGIEYTQGSKQKNETDRFFHETTLTSFLQLDDVASQDDSGSGTSCMTFKLIIASEDVVFEVTFDIDDGVTACLDGARLKDA